MPAFPDDVGRTFFCRSPHLADINTSLTTRGAPMPPPTMSAEAPAPHTPVLTAPRHAPFLAEHGEVWAQVGDFKRTRMLWPAMANLLRHAHDVIRRGVPGDYAEFGTWKCGSLYAVARTWERLGATDRRLLGFDSFEGLPAPIERVDGPWLAKGVFADADFDECREFFDRERLSDRVTLVRGWFDRTASRIGEHTLALLHIDADLYESVKTALEASWDRLSPGGVAVFDDYRHPDCAGCTIAVEEFFASRDEVIHTQPGMNYSAFVRKSDGRGAASRSSSGTRTKWTFTPCTETLALDSADAARAEAAAAREEARELRRILVSRCIAECARRGFRNVALFGAGQHTREILAACAMSHAVRVVAIVDDDPRDTDIAGVPVHRAGAFTGAVDAVIVSSQHHERALAQRALVVFGSRGVPVLTIYNTD
jgi:hypothetical protein